METYITICNIDSQWEFAVWLRKLRQGLCINLDGWDGEGDEGRFKRERRNGMDLTEAKDIKKRWQEYTELYKKDLHDPDNHDRVITHLEPDILECEVLGLRKHHYEQS